MSNDLPPREPKKRGRPKGSRNKKKTKRQRQLEAAATADDAFERAFQNVPAIDNIGEIEEEKQADNVNEKNTDDISEETETFGLNLLPNGIMDDEEEVPTDEDNSNENEEAIHEDDHNVGFGAADMYDVEELIELSHMNLRGEGNSKEYESTDDIIKDLRVGCVSENSKKMYESANVMFLLYIYKMNKHLMHKTWLQTINSFTYGIRDDTKKTKMKKKTIKKLLHKADETCPPINFKDYSAKDFMIYLLSLQTKKKQD